MGVFLSVASINTVGFSSLVDELDPEILGSASKWSRRRGSICGLQPLEHDVTTLDPDDATPRYDGHHAQGLTSRSRVVPLHSRVVESCSRTCLFQI